MDLLGFFLFFLLESLLSLKWVKIPRWNLHDFFYLNGRNSYAKIQRILCMRNFKLLGMKQSCICNISTILLQRMVRCDTPAMFGTHYFQIYHPHHWGFDQVLQVAEWSNFSTLVFPNLLRVTYTWQLHEIIHYSKTLNELIYFQEGDFIKIYLIFRSLSLTFTGHILAFVLVIHWNFVETKCLMSCSILGLHTLSLFRW